MRHVSSHHLSDGDLDDDAVPDDAEALLLLDAALKATELLLFTPVVKGGDQHHTQHREEDSRSLYPSSLRLAFILHSTHHTNTSCGTERGKERKRERDTERGREIERARGTDRKREEKEREENKEKETDRERDR